MNTFVATRTLPAIAPGNWSVWRRFLDKLIEGRRRTAEHDIPGYLRDLKRNAPEFRIELERRMMGQ